MHVRKALDELMKLTSAPATVETFVTASVLLDGLEKDNSAANESGQRENGTVDEKLSGARGWFEILCGIGEDGNWAEDRVRNFIMQDLSVIGHEIDLESEDSPSAHFKRWPAVESNP